MHNGYSVGLRRLHHSEVPSQPSGLRGVHGAWPVQNATGRLYIPVLKVVPKDSISACDHDIHDIQL